MTLKAMICLFFLLAGLGFACIAPIFSLCFLARLFNGWKTLRRRKPLQPREALRLLIAEAFRFHPISPALHNIPTPPK